MVILKGKSLLKKNYYLPFPCSDQTYAPSKWMPSNSIQNHVPHIGAIYMNTLSLGPAFQNTSEGDTLIIAFRTPTYICIN